MATICAGRTGPAVGAKGLIGLTQEGCWGSQQPSPRKYFDMLNEAVVSEIGSLISAAIRPDRAVHKRIGGVESAGGDVNVELGPTGYGTLMKHSLGVVESTRVDNAFVLKVTNGAVTAATLTIAQGAGLSTTFTVNITNGSGNFVANLGDASANTIGELMALINAHADLAAYSPEDYFDGTNTLTLQSADYSAATDPSNTLEAYSAVDVLADADNPDWMVNRGWGVYSHAIKGHSELPEGMSILVGRDVAAFLYAGCKINTFNITATPGEILTSTFGVMAKGGTTVSAPTAIAGNTGNEKNAFEMRYIGEGASCTVTIVKGDTFEINSATASEDLKLNIAEEYVEPSTGRVYAVHKLGGLLEYLLEVASDYIDLSISDYADWEQPSTYLKAAAATDIDLTSRVVFNFDDSDIVSTPALWGDYIGADQGTAITFYAKIVTGGVPGTATVEFSLDNVTYYNEVLTSAVEATEVRTGAGNVNTGFTIFFPDDTALITGDIWSFTSFYPQPSSDAVSYASDQDPFSGFEGALYMDDSPQDVMGWNSTLTNNLFGDKYHMGERVRGMLPEQKRNIEGTLTVEFDDLDLYRRFINGTNAKLEIVFTSIIKISDTYQGDSKTEFAMTVTQNNIEFNGATPVIPGEEIITVDMPYVAMWDDVNSLPDMVVTLVNDVPYI